MKGLKYAIEAAVENGIQKEKERLAKEKSERMKYIFHVLDVRKTMEKKRIFISGLSDQEREEVLDAQIGDINELLKYTEFIDLHGYYSDEALAIAEKKSDEVIKTTKKKKCVAFIHGKGIHSIYDYFDDFFDNLLDEEVREWVDRDNLQPKLKPKIRQFLKLKAKDVVHCISVDGEILFKDGFERKPIRKRCGEHPTENSGIVYFMNEAYFDLFLQKKKIIYWFKEQIEYFQSGNIRKDESGE